MAPLHFPAHRGSVASFLVMTSTPTFAGISPVPKSLIVDGTGDLGLSVQHPRREVAPMRPLPPGTRRPSRADSSRYRARHTRCVASAP